MIGEKSKRPRLKPGLRVRREEGGSLVFDPDGDMVLETNETGAEILARLDGTKTLLEIACDIHRLFETDYGGALEDVELFLVEVRRLGLLSHD